jgi:rhodanese-related sulfurtransferase
MANDVPWETDCRTVQDKLLAAASDFLLIDCREPEEHAVARIAGAQLLPMSQLAGRLSELDAHRSSLIVVHCHHGGRSLKVAAWLREQGFARAQSLAGGIDRWSLEIDASVPRY